MDSDDKDSSATIYLRVSPELKRNLKQIALNWERERDHRVTVNDVGTEVLERFVRDEQERTRQG